MLQRKDLHRKDKQNFTSIQISLDQSSSCDLLRYHVDKYVYFNLLLIANLCSSMRGLTAKNFYLFSSQFLTESFLCPAQIYLNPD